MEPMSTPPDTSLRSYKTLALERKGRLLTIALNRPEALNAVNHEMHEELSDAFNFAALTPRDISHRPGRRAGVGGVREGYSRLASSNPNSSSTSCVLAPNCGAAPATRPGV